MRRIGTGARRVLWIGGIHGNEPEGKQATAALADAFDQAGLGASVTLTILEDANPDGRALGTRENANHVDLNRNFPASNFDSSTPEYGRTPLSQPESTVIDGLLRSEKPDLVIVCHSWPGKQFINYDGPAAGIAQRWSTLSGMPIEQSEDITPTPGSLGSYVGVTQGKPILTVEFKRGLDPAAAWTLAHDAALDVIAH